MPEDFSLVFCQLHSFMRLLREKKKTFHMKSNFLIQSFFFLFFFLCSYLLIPNVLAAAISRKCTMLHPGYGFLAENAVFVEMCREHGINFIGPNVSRPHSL